MDAVFVIFSKEMTTFSGTIHAKTTIIYFFLIINLLSYRVL